MRWIRVAALIVLVFTGLSVSATADEEMEAGSDRAAIDVLFDRMRIAIDEQNTDAFLRLFDQEALIEAVATQASLDTVNKEMHSALAVGIVTGISRAFSRRAFPALVPGRLHRVLRRGTDRAVVYTRHRDVGGELWGYRWDLLRTSRGWRIYDVTDLSVGLSASIRSGLLLGPALGGKAPAWLAAALRFSEGLAAWSKGDRARAASVFSDLAGSGFPPSIESVRLALLGASLLEVGDVEGGLRAAGGALALMPGMPHAHLTRARALNALERREKALAHAETYLEILGTDAKGLYQAGRALAGLGRDAEALARWREGLVDDPRNLDLLTALLLRLPPDEKTELRPMLCAREDLVEVITTLGEAARGEQDPAALALLVSVLQEQAPDHPYRDYYEGHWLIRSGEFEKAAAAFARGWPKLEDPDERAIVVSWFLRAMVEAGRPVEAWRSAPDSEAAFEGLFRTLVQMGRYAELTRLAEAAAEGWVPLWSRPCVDGLVAYRGGDFAEACSILETAREPLASAAPLSLRSAEGQAWGHWHLLWAIENTLFRALWKVGRRRMPACWPRRSPPGMETWGSS